MAMHNVELATSQLFLLATIDGTMDNASRGQMGSLRNQIPFKHEYAPKGKKIFAIL